MKERKSLLDSNRLWIALMACLVIGFFSRYLFTDQIIRASDVLTQLFWSVKRIHQQNIVDYFDILRKSLTVNWEPFDNGGRAGEGGGNTLNFLFHRILIFQYFPFPSNIAWLAVLSLLWGGIGTFFYCRTIGVSRFGSFAAGALFALCTENMSLINAGHIQKIETISWMPWAFFFLEKAMGGGRFFHYAMTALMLAVQFFSMHWQIAFYTCLAVAFYWCFHTVARYLRERSGRNLGLDLVKGTTILVLFFTTTAMAFLPLVNWSQQSERSGAMTSGGSSGGGMNRDEGMSWSMPPEEILTYFVPGLVGYSRQEAGEVPAKGQVYYWGRMHFTQTADYVGLLPWLLLPLPLIFRRDRHTWFFTALMGGTLLMALGKYTFVYRFMYDYLPGFATFRVPKMILFLFAFGASVLMARGLDLLGACDQERKKCRYWIGGLAGFVLLLGGLLLSLRMGTDSVLSMVGEMIQEPTRYQSGQSLIEDRYMNMISEAGLAMAFAAGYLLLFAAWFWRRIPRNVLVGLLFLLLLGDLWRVNQHFMVVCPAPTTDKKQAKNDVVTFLEANIGTYRMQDFGVNDSYYYSDYNIPNVSAYVTVSERRYREFLDSFGIMGAMPDILNLKYIVYSASEYQNQKDTLAPKWVPVYSSQTGAVILENRTVLPKAWLVPSVLTVADAQQRLSMLNSPQFNPTAFALVETAPPLPLAAPSGRPAMGKAEVEVYEPNRIVVRTQAAENTLLVVGEKFYKGWNALIDGRKTEIHPTDHILRGVYVPAGEHRVEFQFESVPFKVGKYLTLGSFAFFAVLFGREIMVRRRKRSSGANGSS